MQLENDKLTRSGFYAGWCRLAILALSILAGCSQV
jgi:hypothetical protein